jgi:hypothetical protein
MTAPYLQTMFAIFHSPSIICNSTTASLVDSCSVPEFQIFCTTMVTASPWQVTSSPTTRFPGVSWAQRN